MVNELKDKIISRQAYIGIIGLGYVGLPLTREFLNAGFSVLGFDIDPVKVEKINRGESYIKHIQSGFIASYVKINKFSATNDFTRLREVDVIIICVPTPLGEHKEPDLTFVLNTTKTIAANLRKGHVVVLESTTYPGTTEEELLPILESTGLQVGKDFFLGFSPEREDPGNKKFSTRTIPKIVSGVTEHCLDIIKTLYDQIIIQTVPVSSPRVAEAVKLLENIYRAVNIALVNELKTVFDRMGIDIWEVIEGAKTKPFGYHPFYPGPGLGGHCIPIDPFYLTWKAKEYDISTRFIELAGEINAYMPYYVVEKTIKALNAHKKSIKGAKILLLGLSYKPDIDDLRESPALKIMELLMREGADVDYSDPYFPELPPLRKYKFDKKSVNITPKTLKNYDCIVITTNHSTFDYDMILEHAKLIVDTRNALKLKGIVNGKVYKA
ncbi:MAG: nucleotide sugar dehydrogenase [Candidatus Hydrothermae bacterium]|nr:nucleotide sugar dehydrogenase [Candidatus Hydrothermae bacterium]